MISEKSKRNILRNQQLSSSAIKLLLTLYIGDTQNFDGDNIQNTLIQLNLVDVNRNDTLSITKLGQKYLHIILPNNSVSKHKINKIYKLHNKYSLMNDLVPFIASVLIIVIGSFSFIISRLVDNFIPSLIGVTILAIMFIILSICTHKSIKLDSQLFSINSNFDIYHLLQFIKKHCHQNYAGERKLVLDNLSE